MRMMGPGPNMGPGGGGGGKGGPGGGGGGGTPGAQGGGSGGPGGPPIEMLQCTWARLSETAAAPSTKATRVQRNRVLDILLMGCCTIETPAKRAEFNNGLPL